MERAPDRLSDGSLPTISTESTHGSGHNLEIRSSFPPPPMEPTYEVSITSNGHTPQQSIDGSGTDLPTSTPPKVDKPFFIQMIRSFSLHSLGTQPGCTDDPKWQPTWLRPLPLAGIGALICSLCCLIAALGILLGSDSHASANWPWSPSVFLAIFSAVMDRTTEFALVSAIPVAWWCKAYEGATIAQMQQRWEAGEGVFRAIKNAKHERLLAIATVAAMLVVVNGPFLQKASSVVSSMQTKPVTLQLPIAPELPKGFSGEFGQSGVLTSDATTPALDGFTQNSTIRATNATGCEGSCQVTVRAPGIHIQNCSTQSWDLSSDILLHNASATWGSGQSRNLAPMPIFNTQLVHTVTHPPFAGPDQVELIVGIASFDNCSGKYVETACTLVEAINEYDVIVSDKDVLTFAKPPDQAKVVDWPNNTYVDTKDSPMPLTITALGAFLDGQIFSNATMVPSTESVEQQGAAVMPDASSMNNFVTRYTVQLAVCKSEFIDPTPDILADFNNLLVRSAIIAAGLPSNFSAADYDPGIVVDQTVTANQTLTLNVFKSELKWFAGAAIVQIFAVLAILPVFYGFWKLGVKATMSPLDMAKAFEAPILKEVNSAAGTRGIVRTAGAMKLQFGEVQERIMDGSKEGLTSSRLAIAEADNVVRPRKGTRFDR